MWLGSGLGRGAASLIRAQTARGVKTVGLKGPGSPAGSKVALSTQALIFSAFLVTGLWIYQLNPWMGFAGGCRDVDVPESKLRILSTSEMGWWSVSGAVYFHIEFVIQGLHTVNSRLSAGCYCLAGWLSAAGVGLSGEMYMAKRGSWHCHKVLLPRGPGLMPLENPGGFRAGDNGGKRLHLSASLQNWEWGFFSCTLSFIASVLHLVLLGHPRIDLMFGGTLVFMVLGWRRRRSHGVSVVGWTQDVSAASQSWAGDRVSTTFCPTLLGHAPDAALTVPPATVTGGVASLLH